MSGVFAIAAIALILVGGTAFAALVDSPRGRAARRKARRSALMQVPETPIAAAKDGEWVRLRGHAVATGPLRTSPLSQRRCIGFRVLVHYVQTGERIFAEEQFDSFVLTDGTSEAVVHAPFDRVLDPYDARDFTHAEAGSPELPRGLVELLEQSGRSFTMFGTADPLHYVEVLLQPGDELIAVGRASLEVDEAGRAASPRGLPLRCHLRGGAETVVISDTEVT